MNDKLFEIGVFSKKYNQILNAEFPLLPIYQSEGFKIHIQKRHPDCLKHTEHISEILLNPDYIGSKDERSVELIKKFDDNVLLALNLDIKNQYFYVASLYNVTESKINNRLNSGHLKKI